MKSTAAVAEKRKADTRVRQPVCDNENIQHNLNADLCDKRVYAGGPSIK